MVVYILCFDMKESRDCQLEQIAYWLNYLNSTLAIPPQTTRANAKWSIMLVGLRSDLQSATSASIPTKYLAAWQRKYPRLVIADALFHVSALTSEESIQRFCASLESECGRIFDQHSLKIPLSYKSVLRTCENHIGNQPLISWEVLMQEQQSPIMSDQHTFMSALQYLHAIGRVVLLKNGMVCTNPTMVPQIAAKFISPEEVQLSLLQKETAKVQILDKQQVGCLLNIDTANNSRFISVLLVSFYYSISRLLQELELMCHLEVCYELRSNNIEPLLYLFPSLALDIGILH